MSLTRLTRTILLLCILSPVGAYTQSPATTYSLKTEYLIEPIGLDNPNPRLIWKMLDIRKAAAQTACRILVGTDSVALRQGKASHWNTGWLPTGTSLVTYSGQELKPFTKYYWRLDIADHLKVKSPKFQIASFEMGMMNTKNWQGAWISDNENPQLKPAPYFRKTFQTKKKIKSARAYIATGGLYELSINGRKVGNHRLDPMYTRFDRRTLYVTYDVTKHLTAGQNALGVLLGNGWYNHQSTAVWNFEKAPWRNRPTFCLDLKITYDDGTNETIKSGKDWKTFLSPIVFNSIYTAEHYDARLEQKGWNTVGFDDAKWKSVIYRTSPSNHIVAQAMHPVRNIEEIVSKSITKFNDTTFLFDLGRNISGVSKVKLDGPAGTVVKLKHTERLYPNGRADMSNIDVHYRPKDDKDPFQTDIIILDGNGEQSFMPHFNYKGFQYVEVTSSTPLNLN
ncbi:MAG: family 78 glycoside hydrolase catalytic domain, partial [Bacteroidia bacterium]